MLPMHAPQVHLRISPVQSVAFVSSVWEVYETHLYLHFVSSILSRGSKGLVARTFFIQNFARSLSENCRSHRDWSSLLLMRWLSSYKIS